MKPNPFVICFIMVAINLSVLAQHIEQGEKGKVRWENSILKSESENEEKASSAIEEKHRRSIWYTLMQKKNPDYFKVREQFISYFTKHKNEDSKPKEVCANWLKTQIFYLDKKNRVVAPPKINYNTIRSFAPGVLATVTDSMAGEWHMLGPRNIY